MHPSPPLNFYLTQMPYSPPRHLYRILIRHLMLPTWNSMCRGIKIAFEEDNPTRNIWAALHDEAGIMGKDVRGDVVLMRREGEEYTDNRVSMRVMFEDPQICNRFCKEGITLLGTRCRVSHYRPRTRHGNGSFPSQPTSPISPSHRPPLDADIGSTKQTNDHIDENHGH